MGCISKLGLFALNFAIFLAGAAVVALASIIINKDNSYGAVLTEQGIFTLPIIILIAGLVILIIGFLGCCGAMKENSCMLKTYAFIVAVMLIGEITLGILLLVYPSQAEALIKDGMLNTFEGYGNGLDKKRDDVINNLQHELDCCGVNNYTDWREITWSGGKNVTDSCCKEDVGGCGMNVATMTEDDAEKIIYTRGCYEALKEDLKDETVALGVVLFILAIVQIMAVTCACGLSKKSSYYA